MEFSLLAQATTAVLLVLATLFTYLQVKKRRSTTSIGSHGGQRAPEPPGAWPVIGHLPLLASFTQPHRAFTSLAKRFGPAYIIRMGLRPYLIVSTRETAKECYTVNDHAFATRPPTIAGKLMAYDHSVMGFTPNGAYWREARKIATTELYSARRIESLHAVRSSEVQSWVNNVYARGGEEKERTVEVEMKGEMEELMFNVLMRMVSGKRYFGANVAKEDEEMARRFKGAVKRFNHYLGNTEVYDALPFLEWVDFRGDAREMRRVQRELDEVMQSWVDEHRLKRERRESGSQDFIDVLVSMADGGGFSSALSDSETAIKALALTQLVAGVDSMASTLVWAITLLLTNPTNLSQAQHELDTHVGRDTLVTESHLPNLPFLQALIKETLRLYPVGPLLVPHQAMEDCTVSSYHIPRGTGLFINAWAIQRDPDIWSDPDQFDPSRFLEGGRNEGVDMRGRDFELLPFGSGRRSCPGVGVAQQVMQLTLARVLQAFDVGEVPGVGVDVEEGLGILLYKLNPLRVRLTPRLPARLYK